MNKTLDYNGDGAMTLARIARLGKIRLKQRLFMKFTSDRGFLLRKDLLYFSLLANLNQQCDSWLFKLPFDPKFI